MIRNKKLSMLALSAAVLITAAGCTKTEEINILDTYQRAYLSRCIVPNNEFNMVSSGGNAFTNAAYSMPDIYEFYLRTTYPAESVVGATLCVPEDYKEIVENYNHAHGTEYGALGADYVDFVQDYATVKSGSTKSKEVYRVKFADKPVPAGEYLLPVSFVLDKGAPAKSSTSAHVVFLKRRSSATGITAADNTTMPGDVYALTNTAFTYSTDGSFSNIASAFDGNTSTTCSTTGNGANTITVNLNTPSYLRYVAIYSNPSGVSTLDYSFSFEYRYEGETEFRTADNLGLKEPGVGVFNLSDYIDDTTRKVAAVKIGHNGANVSITELYLFVPFANRAAN